MGADDGPVIEDKGRDGGYSQTFGKLPIGIDRFPEGPCLQDFPGLRAGKPHRCSQTDQFIGLGDINPIDIVSPEDGGVKFIPLTLALRPFAQFRGQPAVVCFRSLPERQSQFFGRPFLAGNYLPGIEVQAGVEIIQVQPFFRGVGMEGERPPDDLNLEVPAQFFNTPGTEVAPGSDIIGKDLKDSWHRHTIPPI